MAGPGASSGEDRALGGCADKVNGSAIHQPCFQQPIVFASSAAKLSTYSTQFSDCIGTMQIVSA